MATKRLRIFAGPNGSGKSTIFGAISRFFHCKYFVNADEIQKNLKDKGYLNFDAYTIIVDQESFVEALRASSLFDRMRYGQDIAETLIIDKNKLSIPIDYVDSYFAAFISEYIRRSMLNIVTQFTIETVMSDARKIQYIQQAKNLGYRIYLYYVSTKDVTINIKRVEQRVQLGGHSVPEEKIRSRYKRSLDNLYDVLKLCDRAYFFDNSGEDWQMVAEFDNGKLTLKDNSVPGWFNDSILSKLGDNQ